jgi:hypothetical protein
MTHKIIVVTDLGLFKAYGAELVGKLTSRIELLETITLDPAHHRLGDLVTDFSGRRSAPTNKNWGAPVGDDHNLRLEFKQRLIRTIAGHIQRLLTQMHEGCWLAASKEVGHQIIDELPGVLRPRIEKYLACDLTKVPPKEVLDHFLSASPAHA